MNRCGECRHSLISGTTALRRTVECRKKLRIYGVFDDTSDCKDFGNKQQKQEEL